MNNSIYLATVPDDVKMTRLEFVKLLEKFKYHRSCKFGFSKKHTADIAQYRKNIGATSSIPGNVYELPVTYNTEVTYVV